MTDYDNYNGDTIHDMWVDDMYDDAESEDLAPIETTNSYTQPIHTPSSKLKNKNDAKRKRLTAQMVIAIVCCIIVLLFICILSAICV